MTSETLGLTRASSKPKPQARRTPNLAQSPWFPHVPFLDSPSAPPPLLPPSLSSPRPHFRPPTPASSLLPALTPALHRPQHPSYQLSLLPRSAPLSGGRGNPVPRSPNEEAAQGRGSGQSGSGDRSGSGAAAAATAAAADSGAGVAAAAAVTAAAAGGVGLEGSGHCARSSARKRLCPPAVLPQ